MLPEYLVDASPLAAPAGARPVASSVACGAGDGVLGVAVVVASRMPGALTWGHASLRVISCEAGAVRDLEYEVYRLGEWNERLLRLEHADLDLDDGYLASQRGALTLFRNLDPVDRGWFAQVEGDENRDLWEVWLALPPERLAEVAAAAAAWYEEQRAALATARSLPERYVPWGRNCTAVLRDLLPELDPGSSLPFAWLRAIEDDAQLRVVHPSPHLAAALGSAARTPRRRSVLRRRPPLEPTAATGAALGPWQVDVAVIDTPPRPPG